MPKCSVADLNAAAREAGLTYAAVREILANLQREDDEGISFGRAVEALRELALATAQRLASKEIEERDRLRAECCTTKP